MAFRTRLVAAMLAGGGLLAIEADGSYRLRVTR
jgi:hypothetical protein